MNHEESIERSRHPEHEPDGLSLRRRVFDVAIIAIILSACVVSWAALSIAGDIRNFRRDFTEGSAAAKAGTFARLDDMVLAMREFLGVARVLTDRLDTQLTQARVQIKQTGEDTNKTAISAIQATTKAAVESAKHTEEVIAAVNDQPATPAPQITVEAPKALPAPTVVVNPTVPTQRVETPHLEPERKKRGKFHWLMKLFKPGPKKKSHGTASTGE
jgi:hypothetical protein